MASLYSRYTSGTQFSAGAMVGSVVGTSGLNPIVDRLNSISTDNNLVTGSLISGTATNIYGVYQAAGNWNGNVSGTASQLNGSAGFIWGDHPIGSNFRIVNIMLGTGSVAPMSASGCPIGTIYLQYTS